MENNIPTAKLPTPDIKQKLTQIISISIKIQLSKLISYEILKTTFDPQQTGFQFSLGYLAWKHTVYRLYLLLLNNNLPNNNNPKIYILKNLFNNTPPLI